MHIASFAGRPSAITAAGCARRTRRRSTTGRRCSTPHPAATPVRPRPRNHHIARGLYHTDWLRDLALGWLDTLDADDDWMLWLSFLPIRIIPGIRRPTRTAASTGATCRCRAATPARRRRSARCWRASRRIGSNITKAASSTPRAGAAEFPPAGSSPPDNVREINAKVHVMNELIDEAVGQVMAKIAAKGWNDDTDVIFTTDHGEMQGDFGLMYKGPVPCRCADAAALPLAPGRRTRRSRRPA